MRIPDPDGDGEVCDPLMCLMELVDPCREEAFRQGRWACRLGYDPSDDNPYPTYLPQSREWWMGFIRQAHLTEQKGPSSG